MAKAKTSQKQKPFSLDDLTPVALKPGVKSRRHDPTAKLANQGFIADALMECLLDGDFEEFKDILRAHYDAINTTKALKKAGLSRRTFYAAVSPKGNPSLSTVMKMISGLRRAG